MLNIAPSAGENGGQPLAQSVRHAFDKALEVGGRGIGDTTVRVLDATIPEGIRRTAIEEAADLVVVGRGVLDFLVRDAWMKRLMLGRLVRAPMSSFLVSTTHAGFSVVIGKPILASCAFSTERGPKRNRNQSELIPD